MNSIKTIVQDALIERISNLNEMGEEAKPVQDELVKFKRFVDGLTPPIEECKEMKYSDTKITNDDIRKWIEDFTNAFEVIDHLEEKVNGDKSYLKHRMHDALFLVAYVESQLGIEVESEVYDRARELQMGVREI